MENYRSMLMVHNCVLSTSRSGVSSSGGFRNQNVTRRTEAAASDRVEVWWDIHQHLGTHREEMRLSIIYEY